MKVSGAITDFNRNGLPDMTVLLTSDFDFKKEVGTDSGGHFEVSFYAPDREGVYRLTARFVDSDLFGYTADDETITFSVQRRGKSDDLILGVVGLVAIAALAIAIAALVLRTRAKQLTQVEETRAATPAAGIKCGQQIAKAMKFCPQCGAKQSA